MIGYRALADIRLSVTLGKGVYLIENDKRVRIICGHYGSGKTEFAVNYAIRLAKEGGKPVLADIDIINPYFRSRERTKELEKLGVEVVASSTTATALDVPAISAGIHSVFDDTSRDAVVDVGGNEAGVKVLNRFADHFKNPAEYELFFIINANRPETSECSQILDFIGSFENACGISVSGLINNTHMLKSTTIQDIIAGYKLSTEVSKAAGIQLRYNTGLKRLGAELPAEIMKTFFPLELHMREDWMS